jgi:hypothetical protein
MGLDKSNSIIIPNISFTNSSFIPDNKSAAKFWVKVSHNLFMKYKPKFLITLEGDNSVADSICNVAKKFNIQSICFQWGVFPRKYPKVPLMNMPYNFYISSGPLFSKILKPHNKNTMFLETGNLINIKKERKINKILFILQPNNYISSKYDLIALSKLAIDLSEKFTNWNFVIRDHPIFNFEELNLKKNNNIIIERYYSKSINESLAESKIIVSISSSVIIESLLFNVIPCMLLPYKKFDFYPDFKKNKIGFVNYSPLKIKMNIVNLIKNKNTLKRYQNNIRYKSGSFFSKNISSKKPDLLRDFFKNKFNSIF